MIPDMTAHRVCHRLRLVPAGVVETGGMHGEDVRHRGERQIHRRAAGRTEGVRLRQSRYRQRRPNASLDLLVSRSLCPGSSNRIRVRCRSYAGSRDTGSRSKTPVRRKFRNGLRRMRSHRCKSCSCLYSRKVMIWVALRAPNESVLLAGDFAEARDNLLPAFAHALERSIVLGQHEAGVDQANARSVFGLGKGEGDDGLEW